MAMARAWKARGINPSQVRVLSPPQRTKSKIFTLLERVNLQSKFITSRFLCFKSQACY